MDALPECHGGRHEPASMENGRHRRGIAGGAASFVEGFADFV
jgi:hypothetical protein